MTQTMDSPVVAYYRDRLAHYGETVEAVGWNADNQRRRFELLTQGWDFSAPRVVLDVGCGLAHLYDWMGATKGWPIRYCGVDVVREMVEAANRRHGWSADEGVVWVADAEREEMPDCDYAVASGLFNLEGGADIPEVIERLMDVARLGVAFDCLSTHHPDQVEGQVYRDPVRILQWLLARYPSARVVGIHHDPIGNLVIQVNKEV